MVAELLKNFERILNDYLLVSLPPFSMVISAFQLGLRRWHFYQPCLVPSFDFWGLKNRQKYRKLYNHSFSLHFWNPSKKCIMCSLFTTCFTEKWKMDSNFYSHNQIAFIEKYWGINKQHFLLGKKNRENSEFVFFSFFMKTCGEQLNYKSIRGIGTTKIFVSIKLFLQNVY